MNNLILLLSTVTVCIGVQGCATITKGKTDTVQVQISNCSESIKCTASNKKGSWNFLAPGSITFTKSDNDLTIICDDGEGVISQRLTPTRGGSAWGNVLLGGGIGGIVDASTDAHWNMVDSIILHRNYCFGISVSPLPKQDVPKPEKAESNESKPL